MQEANRSNPSPSWSGIGQVARPCNNTGRVPELAGRCPRDQGPPAVLGASRLFVLLVAARRWVLAGNRTSNMQNQSDLSSHDLIYITPYNFYHEFNTTQ